jgi:hypothetical protein
MGHDEFTMEQGFHVIEAGERDKGHLRYQLATLLHEGVRPIGFASIE